ncbi:hypothetical protein [Nocardia sp. BMG51109]|uniref:hypothetical protein n=1 Tax=Nocardia sp. BMG51109 TaxID=1056816 RepID=UPI0004662A70|nr:hypothetical protein [Nocardia sp. BMG51109]
MLKSYKELARWYPALEAPSAQTRPAVREQPVFADDGFDAGAARYPHYIRDTEPEPVDVPFAGESTRHSEFTGGWADWVGDHAPGPDDDYPERAGDVVRFPWDDEEIEPEVTPRRRPVTDLDATGRVGRDGPGAAASPHTLRERTRPDPWRVALVLAVAVLVLAVAGAVAVYVLHIRGGPAHSAGPASAVRLTSGIGGGAAGGFCPTETAERVIRGAEPGGTDSGPAAIMWFQHSYYVERSAERAREVVAPGAPVSPASVIQRGIDSVPPGTAHCVRVATVSADGDGTGKYAVEVTERRPGGAPATYGKQAVTTAVIGGRTLITGIAAG